VVFGSRCRSRRGSRGRLPRLKVCSPSVCVSVCCRPRGLTLQHRSRPRSRAHDAGLSPCARNTMREEIGRDTSSSQHAGHAVRRNRTRSAAGTFSGHRQRSRRICHQRCGWPSLSDDERLVEEHARSRGVEEPLVVGETRSTTLLVADPPTALAVTAEGASCAARAVLSDSVSCMLAARRVQADRFPDGVPGAGREPSASMETNAA